MTSRIPIPFTADDVLFNIIGPHSHSGRYLRTESPRADRTPPLTYTGVSPGGFESFSKNLKGRINVLCRVFRSRFDNTGIWLLPCSLGSL